MQFLTYLVKYISEIVDLVRVIVNVDNN